MSTNRSLRSRDTTATSSRPATSNTMSRPRRTAPGVSSPPTITVSRSPSNPPEERKRSIRLTVKMPASKLREVTGGSATEKRHHNIFTDPVNVTGPRSSRSKRKIVEVDSDDDDDEEEVEYDEGEGEGDNASEDEDNENEEAEDSDADADADADGDIDMDDVQTAQVPTSIGRELQDKVQGLDTKTAPEDDEDEDDDEELSELESDAEGEEDIEESAVPDDLVGDEEVEGEAENDDDELGSLSGASTPDLSRMTKRQRGRMELGGDFLQLPMEPQVKKHLTAEEHAMRRAEMARRRKNLSEKRNEEEKMDTINKLLKKQAPKRRGKVSAAETAAGDATPRVQEVQEAELPEPTMIRYVISREGCRVGVPEQWLGTPAGSLFGNVKKSTATVPPARLVQEL